MGEQKQGMESSAIQPEKLEQLKSDFNEFGIYPNEKYILIRLNSQLTEASYNELEVRTGDDRLKPPQHFIIDASNARDLNPLWVRYCVGLKNRLVPHKKQLSLVNASKALIDFLKQQGLNSSFGIYETLDPALVEMGIAQKKKSFDVSIINPFLVEAEGVVKAYCATESKPGKVQLLAAGAPFSGEISGIIPIDCANFDGIFVLSFPTQTILNITSKMMDGEYKEVDEMVLSAAGELTNIIFSKGRKELNTSGYGIKPGLPKVVSSNVVTDEYKPYKLASLVVPFENAVGQYFAEIRIRKIG